MSVDLQSVNVSIAGRQIVRDVCLQIRDGQRVGLIGSSGSGKSMIARAIMGLLPQDTQLSGSINVNGTQTVGMNDVQLARLRGAAMGMVFQNPDNQIVANVVEEDVAFAPENLGVASEEIRRPGG